MSRFTELKASGTDRVGFPTPRSGVMEAMLAGANRRPMPQRKPMMTDSSTLDRSGPGAGATPRGDKARANLSPLAIVALSGLGTFLGLALVLNSTRFGSVGRYQFASRSDNNIVRMDTTTGEISLCYGFRLVRPKCLPWGHDDRPFNTVPPSQASQRGDGQ